VRHYEAQLTPTLSGKLWLLAALFTVLLPHLLRMPPLLSLASIAVFGWRLAHEVKGWSLPRRPLRWLLTLIFFAGVFLTYKTVVGRDAGVALLTVMLCLKLIELHTLRDAMVTLYLGYFLVIGGFLFSQSVYNGLYLLLVVLLLTAALIALNHPNSAMAHTRYYLRYAGQLLLQAFPIMVVMFILFPRLDSPLWSMPQGNVGKTGLSDQIRMGTISSLVASQEVAFRVEFKGALPDADQLYWRGPVLWTTDGRDWQRTRQTVMHTIPAYQQLSAPVEYTVTLESSGYSWLFSLDLPSSMPQGLDHASFILSDFQLLSEKVATDKQRYTIRSALSYRNEVMFNNDRRMALQLPSDVNRMTVAMAQAWIAEGLDAGQLVERALAYYRDNDFYYTRQPPLLTVDPVDDFLFNTRRGFCEHYATSFVTLMRAAGVPARVVTGYQGGERNNLGNYLIVRQSSAHAWAEVWLDGEGWQRVDPTSHIPAERVEETVDAQRFATTDLLSSVAGGSQFNLFARTFFQLRQVWDSVNYGWNMWVLGFDREQQDKLLRALGIRDMSWQNLLLTLVGLITFLVAAISLFILLRRPRQTDPVVRAYLLFCRKLARKGTVRGQGEGPQDFAKRASLEQPGDSERIREITRLYVQLRYAPEVSGASLKQLKRSVANL